MAGIAIRRWRSGVNVKARGRGVSGKRKNRQKRNMRRRALGSRSWRQLRAAFAAYRASRRYGSNIKRRALQARNIFIAPVATLSAKNGRRMAWRNISEINRKISVMVSK